MALRPEVPVPQPMSDNTYVISDGKGTRVAVYATRTILADDINPDTLSRAYQRVIRDLEELGEADSIALDWNTIAMSTALRRPVDAPLDVLLIQARVEVLS